MPDSTHTCGVCQQSFSSRNHLRRHETLHVPGSQILCKFCGRQYSRNDALRRHYRSCSQLRRQIGPAPDTSGRRRKACDSCASSRVACDGQTPCATCLRSDKSCSYQRLGTQQQVINNSTGVLVNSRAKSAQRVGVRTRRDRDKKVSLPFLLNYSATSDRHPGDVNHVLTQLASTEGNEGAKDTSLPSLHLDGEKNGFFAEDSWNLFFETFQDAETQQIVPLPLGLDDQERRSLAAERILQCILETTAANPGLGEDLDIERAQEFFQEENILSSILAYFDNTVRPRCRIVLKSTFNLDLTSPGLLLSMILMGAICGMSEDIKLKSVEYLDMAEFAVFESQCFHDLVHGIRQGESVSLPRKSVEIIQAAILVILLQISSPNPTARRRIRIQRYPALVSAARTTGLTKVKNQWHDSSILNYEQFIRNEICIRMMASICMIDSHFIMFFNDPPLFSATEFTFDLPAEDKGIDISDIDTWQEWAQNERRFQRPPLLSEFLQLLLGENWAGITDPRFERLSIFPLFIVISAFHTVIFGLRSSLLDMSDAKDQVERALSRWRSLWEHLQPQLTEDQIYRAGFMTHAQDLCEFAKILLRSPMSETGGIARNSMIHVHELLSRPST